MLVKDREGNMNPAHIVMEKGKIVIKEASQWRT
jgi:hypothetical protein